MTVATDASVSFMIPGDAVDPLDTGTVGASLEMPYGVWGRFPRRSVDDVVMSTQKHLAEVLDERAGEWLAGYDENGDPAASQSWEVRPWGDGNVFRLPFARVVTTGPDTVTGRTPLYADHAQSMVMHLYLLPAQDAERALVGAERLRGVIEDAFEFGAVRTAGLGPVIPLWDFVGVTDLYGDSEARQPSDYVRVAGLTTERMIDPEDDRFAWIVVNFRAQWRRFASGLPGLLVSSVRITAHPE